jgi:acyl carrier protein
MEQKLIEEMADILEVDASELTLDTVFKAPEYDWDSLKGYAIIVMVEDEFGKEISVDDFIEIKTIKELQTLINA